MKELSAGSYQVVAGENFGTPKEVWGFRCPTTGGPRRGAQAFLRANAGLLGLDRASPGAGGGAPGLVHQKTIRSPGAHHFIFQQVHRGRGVHRAYVTVHMARTGTVYLVKNRAVPRALLPPDAGFELTGERAVALARQALPRPAREVTVQAVVERWYFVAGRLEPSVRVRLQRAGPREEWIVYLHARTGQILSRYDNLAQARGRARVFHPSPVTALGSHESLLTRRGVRRRPPAEAYIEVTLYSLDHSGYLQGRRVTTEPTAAERRVHRGDRRFVAGCDQPGFEEAMVYHHIDSAVRYLERLGFRGTRAVFREPVKVDVNGSPEDNSWYSPWLRQLTFGTGAINDAEDGETILHELGHALQDAIVQDFGQSDQAAAMGEGFGDYFAASFYHDVKPEAYRVAVMTWDGLLLGLDGGRHPPALRYLDRQVTFDDFDAGAGEHGNGEIWSATLWDVRRALGGETADRVIVESHFQLDGFTTFARGARAIMDADDNLNGGAHRHELRGIFALRKIAPV